MKRTMKKKSFKNIVYGVWKRTAKRSNWMSVANIMGRQLPFLETKVWYLIRSKYTLGYRYHGRGVSDTLEWASAFHFLDLHLWFRQSFFSFKICRLWSRPYLSVIPIPLQNRFRIFSDHCCSSCCRRITAKSRVPGSTSSIRRWIWLATFLWYPLSTRARWPLTLI